MTGLLDIAAGSLNAYQRALTVIGNNISNANTAGYTRQMSIFETNAPTFQGGFYVGTGTELAAIRRLSDQFAIDQVRQTTTSKAQLDMFYQQASQIDDLLSQDGTSIATSLQDFFNGMSQLNNAPESLSARTVVLKQSALLSSQFQTLQTQLNEHKNRTMSQLNESAGQVNKMTGAIAEINQSLLNRPGDPALLDQRDNVIQQLAEYVDVVVDYSDDGSANVSLSNGQTLVLGDNSIPMSVKNTSNTGGSYRILLGEAGAEVDITNSIRSGRLKGLIDFDVNVVGKADKLLGQISIGLAETFNAQHKLGMDINNQLGKDFFTDYNTVQQQLDRAAGFATNTGTGILSVAISDVGQTQLSDYELTVTNAATNEIRMTRLSDGTSTVINWTNTPPAPPAGQIVIDGMTIQVDDVGNLADNDKYTISPTSGAAANFDFKLSTPQEVAMAAPVRAQATSSNLGTGEVRLSDVYNTTEVMKDYRIEFISPTQYNLVNVTDAVTTGPFVFTPGADNQVDVPDSISPSYSVTVSGVPKTGDSFTMEFNSGGYKDNFNGMKLSEINNAKIFNAGTENLFERYTYLTVEVGSQVYKTERDMTTADILFQQAQDLWESKSGVNLDEEAANLMRFEKSYQAAAQLMTVSKQLIDTIFSAMR